MADFEIVSKKLVVAEPWLLEDTEVVSFGKSDEIRKKLEQDYDLRVGDRPFARKLRRLYELRKQPLPPEFATLKGEVYLVTHAVGMAAAQGAGRVDIIGYRASFEGLGATVELFPNTRFREYIAADLTFQAGIAADGYAKSPALVGQLAKELINLGAGAELQLGTKAGIVGKLSLSLKTPEVQAVGNASSTITWQLNKAQDPLVGDQVLVQTLVVPKGQETVTFRMQGFAVIDPGLFHRPVRVETETATVTVELE